ncbi:MAG: aminotransferase class IV [Candidatus Woesearchaeota archaeon]|nr:aminotransferase class IV [Candidatus Woesearchaeota archaeon]
MLGAHLSKNGQLIPVTEGVVPVDNLAFTYGYGVYESMKVRHGHLFFPELHVQRLRDSAAVLGMQVRWKDNEILGFVHELVADIGEDAYNIKMLLVGGELFIFGLAPTFVPKKLYKQGAHTITYVGERLFPNAKSLNMLMSYLAYTQAKAASAYDALLVDHEGYIPEGTRTNLFFTDGTTIYTPPKQDILQGVTRATLIDALEEEGISVLQKKLHKNELKKYGLFLTSTSSKVVPLKTVDDIVLEIPALVRSVMRIYDAKLSALSQATP